MTDTVVLRAPTPGPKGLEALFISCFVPLEQWFWHQRETATDGGELTYFGKASEFHVESVFASDFENGMRIVLIAQNIENETAVALRTVGHENLIVRDVDLAIAEIFLRNCRSQEFVPLPGSVATKRFTVSQLVSGAFDRFDGRLRQRLGDVADAAATQTLGCVRLPFAVL